MAPAGRPPTPVPAALLAAVLMTTALSACAPGQLLSRQPCLPSPLHLSPTQAAPGATVTLSSPAFECSASYPQGKTYSLTLAQYGRGEPLALGTADVAQDGSFTTEVVIPTQAAPGESYLSVHGSTFDDPCHDGESSCAGYGTPISVQTQTP